MKLLEIRNKLELDNAIVKSDLNYYSNNCDNLRKGDLELVNVQLVGFDGNKTKFMSLNKESLIAIIDVMIRQGVK